MRIDCVDIVNFRKLRATRVGLSKNKTVFVGANNSGKTSAMVALRYFLVEHDRRFFSLHDFTLSLWPKIDRMGQAWEAAQAADQLLPNPDWDPLVPFIDVWLDVGYEDLRYIVKIVPNLDWTGGGVGVRLRYEPKDALELRQQYLAAREGIKALQQAAAAEQEGGDAVELEIGLWPQSLTDYLQRDLQRLFTVKAYNLDPSQRGTSQHGVIEPQAIPAGSSPLEIDPLKGLIQIDEISAQRGLGQPDNDARDDTDSGATKSASATRRLSEQLRRYYNSHLDPTKNPDAADLKALKAIQVAQEAFDSRLMEGFATAITQMETLGYPGITDPRLHISTRLKPVDGLNHESAVQYKVQMGAADGPLSFLLPEASNGLGYQNLISMVFRLMSYRDAWMRVGKRQSVSGSTAGPIPPLHLVLIEEPEAYLHTQVQQLFIRQAYDVLRDHKDLKESAAHTTQLVVSTHSSHVAHACEFEALRYFRRMPADAGDIPTSCVANLTDVFGTDNDTKIFVTRYLNVTHCDLFFADAAVLIEGPAERILVPFFIHNDIALKALSECYITWLEIGGSHAHRFEPLIKRLGLTTLIIADLDAMEAVSTNSAVPKKGQNQRTRNMTLKSWCPGAEQLDDLLAKSADQKVKEYADEKFAIRVAYQCPVTITFGGGAVEALANTLEDALVFGNVDFFRNKGGNGLLGRFKDAIINSATIDALSLALFEDLKKGGKAELAMDLLEHPNPAEIQIPDYLREGLQWLVARLGKQQKEIGLIAPPRAADAAATA
jgi:predicted ATP-dependent endonuclease of OLD family